MKIMNIKILIIVAFGMMLVGCFQNELEASEFVVNEIKLGDTFDDVADRFGSANNEETVVMNEMEYTIYDYDQVEFIFLNNAVVGINSIDEEFRTEQEIGIGSDRTSVENAYEDKDNLMDSYGLMVKGEDTLLHMIYDDDHVMQISISTLSSMIDYYEDLLGFNIYTAFETDNENNFKLAPQNPAGFIYNHLEESLQIEKEITDLQENLLEAESEEMASYQEMLAISDVENIKGIADDAIESANNRKLIMEDEQNIMEESFHSFEKSFPYVETIKDENVKLLADELVKTMNERYERYQDFFEAYSDSITKDIKLYEIIKDENSERNDLQEQHEAVNEAYSRIFQLNEEFNQLTNIYNEMKLKFYQAAELDVVLK